MSFQAGVLPNNGAYKEERPQLQQFIPEKPKVGHLEAARPSAVSDMFAAIGVSFGRPLFPTLVSPIPATFDVQFNHSPPRNVCGWDDWDQFPIPMNQLLQRPALNMSHHSASGQRRQGRVENSPALELGCRCCHQHPNTHHGGLQVLHGTQPTNPCCLV